jgi:hypothetical protein
MLKPLPYLNEIVSLTVMLLMIIALVAGQADAKSHEQARFEAAAAKTVLADRTDMPFKTIIRAHIDGQPLTIAIDAEAEFRPIHVDDE